MGLHILLWGENRPHTKKNVLSRIQYIGYDGLVLATLHYYIHVIITGQTCNPYSIQTLPLNTDVNQSKQYVEI